MEEANQPPQSDPDAPARFADRGGNPRPPYTKGKRNWHAHNTEGVQGWAVAAVHPSGDGSHYAPVAQHLTEQDAKLIAGAEDMAQALSDLVEKLGCMQYSHETYSLFRAGVKALEASGWLLGQKKPES